MFLELEKKHRANFLVYSTKPQQREFAILTFKSYRRLNALPQIPHLKGLSLLWVSKCLCKRTESNISSSRIAFWTATNWRFVYLLSCNMDPWSPYRIHCIWKVSRRCVCANVSSQGKYKYFTMNYLITSDFNYRLLPAHPELSIVLSVLRLGAVEQLTALDEAIIRRSYSFWLLTFKSNCRLNDLTHSPHLNGRSSLCVSKCLCKPNERGHFSTWFWLWKFAHLLSCLTDLWIRGHTLRIGRVFGRCALVNVSVKLETNFGRRKNIT